MTELRVKTAAERRADIRANAEAMGIDEAYISTLVETFYGHIRAHGLIGPIFERAIGDDWDRHMIIMKSFWASVALNAGTYSGKPVPAHKKHTNIQPWHFGIWLTLFHQTLKETAPTPGAIDYFMERAERIAKSLQLAMFGDPELEKLMRKR